MNVEELYTRTRMEIKQRREEGCDVGELAVRHGEAERLEPDRKRQVCRSILAALDKLPPDPKYTEPSELDAIRHERPAGPRRMGKSVTTEELHRRTYGGWLGRCAGCLLGKPVEGATRSVIRKVAEADGNYPLKDYFAPVAAEISEPGPPLQAGNPSLRGYIKAMPRDDDIDYTLIGLMLLEGRGPDFTTQDVANVWLDELPFNKVYTAERIAYANLVDGVSPDRAGELLNPCREWIGAQIRADALGYACPGLPEMAAELGYRDALLSHRKNGIYGEMLAAAMIGAAYVERDVEKIIEVGLSEIPRSCRLAEAVSSVVRWWNGSRNWQAVADNIDARYGDLQGCHTITNAAIVILGLLAGAEDFTAGLAAAVMPGYDTDCNGATVGSILGVRAGADKLPRNWIEPLNDRLETIVSSVHRARISDLARRTVNVAIATPGE